MSLNYGKWDHLGDSDDSNSEDKDETTTKSGVTVKKFKAPQTITFGKGQIDTGASCDKVVDGVVDKVVDKVDKVVSAGLNVSKWLIWRQTRTNVSMWIKIPVCNVESARMKYVEKIRILFEAKHDFPGMFKLEDPTSSPSVTSVTSVTSKTKVGYGLEIQFNKTMQLDSQYYRDMKPHLSENLFTGYFRFPINHDLELEDEPLWNISRNSPCHNGGSTGGSTGGIDSGGVHWIEISVEKRCPPSLPATIWWDSLFMDMESTKAVAKPGQSGQSGESGESDFAKNWKEAHDMLKSKIASRGVMEI